MKITNQQKLENHLQEIIQNFFNTKSMSDLTLDRKLTNEQIELKDIYEIEIYARAYETPEMNDQQYDDADAKYQLANERQLSRWVIDGEPLLPTYIGTTNDDGSNWIIWYLVQTDAAHISIDIRAKHGEKIELQLKFSEIYTNKIESLDLYEEYMKNRVTA